MGRVFEVLIVIAIAGLALGTVACFPGTGPGGDSDSESESPNAVRDLMCYGGDDGETVVVSWSTPEPASGVTITGYRVWFNWMDGATEVTQLAGTTGGLSLVHDPEGKLGRYEVMAEAGLSTTGPSRSVSMEIWAWTEPRLVSFVDIHDEGAGHSALGWDLEAIGTAYEYAYMQAAADEAALYVTNLLPDGATAPHFFASPHLAATIDADAPVLSTELGLADTRFLDLGTAPPDILPHPDDADYLATAEIVAGRYYAVAVYWNSLWRIYAVMHVESYDPGAAVVAQVRCWSQHYWNCRLFGLSSTPTD